MSPAGFYIWNNATQTWVPRRAATGGGSGYIDRSTLIYGTYKPDATTTGTLPGVTLQDRYVTSGGALTTNPALSTNGQHNITTNGAVLENLDIRGGIKISAANVTIRNCVIRGWVAAQGYNGNGDLWWRAAVEIHNTAGTNFHLIDCDIYNQQPTELHLGITGAAGGTIERCNIHDYGVDGLRIWGGAYNILGCWIHDSVWFPPSQWTPQPEGPHADVIQFAPATYTGTQVIRGCWLDAWDGHGADPANDGPSCIMFPTQVRRVEIDKNWLDWGWFPINLGGTPNVNADVYITNNVMSPGWYTSGSGTTYHIVATSAWQSAYTLSGNTDRDTGGPIRVRT